MKLKSERYKGFLIEIKKDDKGETVMGKPVSYYEYSVSRKDIGVIDSGGMYAFRKSNPIKTAKSSIDAFIFIGKKVEENPDILD